jgi:hypothetical protein
LKEQTSYLTGIQKEDALTNVSEPQLKLYSLNQARILLGIGRATLNNYINAGVIGVIPPPPRSKQSKIAHSEIEKFLSEQSVREKKQSLLTNFTKPDVNEFINKPRRNNMEKFDSGKLFDKILENNNGKRV